MVGAGAYEAVGCHSRKLEGRPMVVAVVVAAAHHQLSRAVGDNLCSCSLMGEEQRSKGVVVVAAAVVADTQEEHCEEKICSHNFPCRLESLFDRVLFLSEANLQQSFLG